MLTAVQNPRVLSPLLTNEENTELPLVTVNEITAQRYNDREDIATNNTTCLVKRK